MRCRANPANSSVVSHAKSCYGQGSSLHHCALGQHSILARGEGIISTVYFIEPPEVVAERICQVVEVMGERSRVIASTDCGFGAFAGWDLVPESVVWAKLRALRQRADLASARPWGA